MARTPVRSGKQQQAAPPPPSDEGDADFSMEDAEAVFNGASTPSKGGPFDGEADFAGSASDGNEDWGMPATSAAPKEAPPPFVPPDRRRQAGVKTTPAQAPAQSSPAQSSPAQSSPAQSSPAQSREPVVVTPNARGGHMAIVETFVAIDVATSTVRLNAELSLGDKRSERAHVKKALDDAAKNVELALRLSLSATEERKRIEGEEALAKGPMRERALEVLSRMKDSGELAKKTISNDDVEAKMRELFADEFVANVKRTAKAKAAEEYYRGLYDLWRARQMDVRAMLGSFAPTA